MRINNPNDRFCLARAVYIGLAHLWSAQPGMGGKQWFKSICIQQQNHEVHARRLMNNSGIPLDLQFYGVEHVDAMQQHLNQQTGGPNNIRLVVFKKEANYRIIYKGPGKAAKHNLCLLLEQEHFSYIGRPEQLFKAQRYCIDCERTANRYRHWAGCKVLGKILFFFLTNFSRCFAVVACVLGLTFHVRSNSLMMGGTAKFIASSANLFFQINNAMTTTWQMNLHPMSWDRKMEDQIAHFAPFVKCVVCVGIAV